MAIHRIDFLGLPLDIGVKADYVCHMLEMQGQLRLVTFINPQAWAIARRDARYLPMLQSMSLVLPDGQGVAYTCRKLTGYDCPRLSFDRTSLADPFFGTAQARDYSLMLMGGKPGVDEMVEEKLRAAFPRLRILGTSHGYGDFEPKLALIMANRPDAVIVAMGSPRQEQFLLALRDAGYGGLAITCGGFFDQYVEADDYYPEWIDKANLRFAWRLYKEPRRLWRRYLIDYQIFLWRVLCVLYDRHMPERIKRELGRRFGRRT